MANETMRIFFPLKIFTYPKGEYGLEDNPVEISPAEAVVYEDAILAAIAKENRLFKNDRGLAEYIHDEALNKEVYSLYPSVEIVDGELWGGMTAGLTEALSGEETAELLDYVVGQNADGYCASTSRFAMASMALSFFITGSNHSPIVWVSCVKNILIKTANFGIIIHEKLRKHSARPYH